MKKIFAIALLAVITLTANAQRKWDFTQWSAATVANLQVGAGQVSPESGWSDIEKATGTAPTEVSANNCFWQVSASKTQVNGVLTANGAVISETDGLYFTNTADRSLAIAVNYLDANPSDAAFGPYHGASYLWLGSSKKNYFIIPNVTPGSTIKMGVESHKTTDARGVELYVTHGLTAGISGTKLLNPDGEANAAPTVYEDFTWVVPAEGLTDEANEDGTYDIQVYNTNGCHVYYITVSGSNVVEEGKNIALVSNGESYADIFVPEGHNYTTIAPTEASSVEALQAYDAVIVSGCVAATDAIVPALKGAIARVPMINFSAALYDASAQTESTTVNVSDAENPLFEGLDITEGVLALNEAEGVTTVTLGDYYASDKILATVGEAVAIHQHNANRNTYIYIPNDSQVSAEVIGQLLINAVNVVTATKKEVTATATPAISQKQADGVTTVTISCATAGAKVYYTVDGTEPTTASTVYSAPFNVTAETVVKAYAEADGYNASAVATFTATIAGQTAMPVITVTKNGAESTITIAAEEGAQVYYSFGSEKVTAATGVQYTAPVVITEPTYVYAIAQAEGALVSEVTKAYAAVEALNAETIRLDEITHFTAQNPDWMDNIVAAHESASGSASAYYYWGKSAWNYYSEEVIGTKEVEVTDENGTVTTEIQNVYAPDANAYREILSTSATDWKLTSQGQVLTGELSLAPEAAVGNGATGRYAETAQDNIGTPSKGVITFGGKTSGDPYTGTITSTKAFTAPFDVVVYCGNGNSGAASNLEIQVSANGTEWTKIADVQMAATQRYYKKTRVAYNEAGDVYVRVAHVGGGTKAQVYDIILLDNGELSKAYDATALENEADGIENVTVAPQRQQNNFIYDLSGRRVSSATAPGLYIMNGKKFVVK